MNPQQYCNNLAYKSGSSFYYSFLFLPKEQKNAITAVYAFCREVDDIVDKISDSDLAKIKLAWWRSEIEELYKGNPSHPITQALKPAINKHNIEKELFLEIIAGMEMDISQHSYESFTDLKLYCYRAASVVGMIAAKIFGYEKEETLQYALNLGISLQLINIIRDVGEDYRRGRVYLPQEDLRKFKVDFSSPDNLINNHNFIDLMEYQALRAKSYYSQAINILPSQDRYKQKVGLIMANIYQRLLKVITKNKYKVLNQRISLTPIKKLFIAYSTLRYEKKLAKEL